MFLVVGFVVMADIEDVFILLSKQINLCTDINFTIDHLRSARNNKENENLTQSWWSVLNKLSHCVITKINPEINLQHYGETKSTKLYFAYLGYDAIEFYSLSENYHNSRAFLIALGWLIAVHDCLTIILHEKVIESLMGCEFVNSNNCIINNEQLIETNFSISVSSKINLLIYKCNKINNNLKEIAELTEEKLNLIAKIHCASLNINNLPHLNTLEVFLIKKLFTQTRNNEKILKECENEFEELHKIAVIIQVYKKLKKREIIFFNFMEILLNESKNTEKNPQAVNNDELTTIICIIRHLTKKKIHTIKLTDLETVSMQINNNLPTISCSSRFLRVDKLNSDEKINNDTKLLQQLKAVNEDIEKKMKKFNCELKSFIKTIPNCLQV